MQDRADRRRFIELGLDGGDGLAWVRGPVETSTAAVLLLHDRATNARSWDLVMRRLPAGIAVLAPDLRGRGSAWRLPPSMGIDGHVADLIRMLEQLDIDHVIAVGHGFGSEVAAQLRRKVPEQAVMTVGVIGAGPDPFAEVLGMAFHDRAGHRLHWQHHPALAALSDNESVDAFLAHGIAGPDDHHRWRVDLRSLIADDASLVALAASVGAAIEPSDRRALTRSIVVGPAQPIATTATIGATAHLPSADPATVVLTPAGADAIAAQIVPLLVPPSVS